MSFKSIQFLVFGVSLIMISSCGKTTEDEVKDAVLSANILLSTSQCQPAIDLLESMGNQPRNAKYLKTLASAYACRAGYSTPTFFGSDIAKTASPPPLAGITLYSTSLESTTSPLVNDSKYKDLLQAINILLYAGGIPTSTDPFSTERAKFFSANEAADINTQLAFMMMVQLGKIVKTYSDAVAGVKGAGTAGNDCFTNYSTTPALVQAYVQTILPGHCNSLTSSHSQLDTGAPNRKARLCQGVVLMNGILDILPSVLTSAAGGSLDDISAVTGIISTKKALLATKDPSVTATALVVSQSNCESDSSITVDTLASYYAIVFESLIE